MAWCFALHAKETEDKLFEIKAVLKSHCLDCHDEDTTKGDLDLTPFLQEFAHHKDNAMQINIEEKKSPQADASQKKIFYRSKS